MAEPLPKQNLLEKMRNVSPFASSEPVVIEVVEFSTPQEYDSKYRPHLCKGERSSSPSIEFEPLPIDPYHVALDFDRESTSILHNEPLEVENSRVMVIEALMLESEGKDSIDEHGSFILDIPHEP
jgi:hypothetical protein